jgi:hypothetical protein
VNRRSLACRRHVKCPKQHNPAILASVLVQCFVFNRAKSGLDDKSTIVVITLSPNAQLTGSTWAEALRKVTSGTESTATYVRNESVKGNAIHRAKLAVRTIISIVNIRASNSA